jgi:hypothetical protein
MDFAGAEGPLMMRNLSERENEMIRCGVSVSEVRAGGSANGVIR